jgi:hypothetical protein
MSHHQPNALYLKKIQYKVSLKLFNDDGFLEAETYVRAF